MLFVASTIVVFAALALLVLHWAHDDLTERGSLSAKSLVASWLLYVLHADTVASAALAHALSVNAPRTPALIMGAAIGVAGFGIFMTSTVTLVRHGDFQGPRTRRLVTTGVYAMSRHPQNLGWGILLLGIAVAGRSLVALALVGLFALFVARYARLEEHQLHTDFGEGFERYRERTPGVLPRPWGATARSSARARTR